MGPLFLGVYSVEKWRLRAQRSLLQQYSHGFKRFEDKVRKRFSPLTSPSFTHMLDWLFSRQAHHGSIWQCLSLSRRLWLAQDS